MAHILSGTSSPSNNVSKCFLASPLLYFNILWPSLLLQYVYKCLLCYNFETYMLWCYYTLCDCIFWSKLLTVFICAVCTARFKKFLWHLLSDILLHLTLNDENISCTVHVLFSIDVFSSSTFWPIFSSKLSLPGAGVKKIVIGAKLFRFSRHKTECST